MEHFTDPWNYLDIVPPVLIVTAEILNLFTHNDEASLDYFRVVRTLYSITAFAMWLRLLYFFRIFEQTNFYIKMLISVVADMGQFMFIFVFTLLAFAHTFYLFFMNHNGIVMEDGTVMSSEFNSFSDAFIFSYNTVFGEYSLGNFNLYIPWVAWVFFILETMWVVVILLNLLISIIGGTYGKVNDNKSSIMF